MKINPKHLEAHFLSLPFANINLAQNIYVGNDVLHISFLRFSECMKNFATHNSSMKTLKKMHISISQKQHGVRKK